MPADAAEKSDMGYIDIDEMERKHLAVFYAMKYTLKIAATPEGSKKALQQMIDGEYGYCNAIKASEYLVSMGWISEALYMESLDMLAVVLEQRACSGQLSDFLAFVSHAGPLGPFFDNPEQPVFERNRAFLNAGWNWYGPGYILEEEAGDGVPSIIALKQLTDRLKNAVKPGGIIMFIGCRTAKESVLSRYEPVPNPRKQGTPFWIDGSIRIRYKSFAHAVAYLSERHVLGNTEGTNLGDAQKLVRLFLIEGKIPKGWVLISPEEGRD